MFFNNYKFYTITFIFITCNIYSYLNDKRIEDKNAFIKEINTIKKENQIINNKILLLTNEYKKLKNFIIMIKISRIINDKKMEDDLITNMIDSLIPDEKFKVRFIDD